MSQDKTENKDNKTMSQDKTENIVSSDDTDFLTEIEVPQGTEEEGTEEEGTEEEEGKRKRKTPEEVESYRKLCISIGELTGMKLAGTEKLYSLTLLLEEEVYTRITAQRSGATTKYAVESLKTLNPVLNNVVAGYFDTDFTDKDSIALYVESLTEFNLHSLELESIIPRPRSISMLEKGIADMEKMIALFEENNETMKDLIDNPAIPEIAKGSLRSTLENNDLVLKAKKAELEVAVKKLEADLLDFARLQSKKNLALKKAKAELEKKKKEENDKKEENQTKEEKKEEIKKEDS